MGDYRITLGLASSHRGTLAQLRECLASLPVEVLPAQLLIDSPPSTLDVEQSFAEKAVRRARLLADSAMVLAIGEASGLAVAALGGEPGVRSARFAGWGATDAENNAELLRRLNDVEAAERRAQFVCALSLVDPWDAQPPLTVSAVCEGSIAHKPSDAGGFGYAPLFIVDGYDKTLADLSEAERDKVGHRSLAIAQLLPPLRQLLMARVASLESSPG